MKVYKVGATISVYIEPIINHCDNKEEISGEKNKFYAKRERHSSKHCNIKKFSTFFTFLLKKWSG